MDIDEATIGGRGANQALEINPQHWAAERHQR